MEGIKFPEWLTPNIPGLPIHWYGLMYVLVAVTTYILMRIQRKGRKDITVDHIDYIFIWAIIGAILGARLSHVIFLQPSLFLEPWKIISPFDFKDGQLIFTGIMGMSFYGGLVGVIVSVYLYCRRKKISFMVVGDMIAAAFPLGYTFGRLGNFFNQEFPGRPAPEWLPWKMYYWKKIGDSVIYDDVARHPSQIYEALLEGVLLWVVVWFIFKTRKAWDGLLMGVYVIGYGVARFITEFFRIRRDPPLRDIGFPLTGSQLVCIGIIALGIVILVLTKKASKKKLAKS
jgi:phosphatidylglycerol:prolipoprotein diacylglycerol transferase